MIINDIFLYFSINIVYRQPDTNQKKAINHLTHIFNSVLRLPILFEFSTVITVPKSNKPLDTVFLFAIHSRLLNHHDPPIKHLAILRFSVILLEVLNVIGAGTC